MKSSRSWQVSVGVAFALSVVTSSARADESAYCRKVEARAAADASLLIAPRVLVEGVKSPSALQTGGKLDPTSPGHGYQLRAGLSWSPLDAYKGVRVMKVGELDCEQHETVVTAQQLLVQAPDLGRLAALREQAAYLDAQQAVWEGISTRMTERFAAQNTSLIELEEVRAQSAALARLRAQIGGEIARLEATGIETYRGSIPELVRRIGEKAMAFEQEASHVRKLDAWSFNITGGYLPPIYGPGSADFFGVVQLGYNIGGPWQSKAENRYLGAREEELQKSRYELARQLQVLRVHVKGASAQATRELAIIERRSSELAVLRETVARSEAPAAAHAAARIELEAISMQADRVFLTGLIRELSHLEVN